MWDLLVCVLPSDSAVDQHLRITDPKNKSQTKFFRCREESKQLPEGKGDGRRAKWM